MAFQDYASELLGWVPGLDIFLAQKLINRGFRDIREARLWSWLTGEGTLVCPAVIALGTVTVTQFSNVVTLDATATANLGNLTNPFLTQRQFRAGLQGGPIYNITSALPNAAAPTSITLDRPYMEQSRVGSSYQVYRVYYTPADGNGNFITDFLMFSVILNPIDGFAIVGKNLRLTKAEFDARDPTRGSQGTAYGVATYKVDANGNPLYELWPHQTFARGLPFLYRRRGLPLSNTQDIPTTLSAELVIEKGISYACDWAIMNQGRIPELKGVDFRLIQAEANRKYEKMLQDAKRQDDNIFLTNYLPDLRDYLNYPPVDSNFMQSHDFGDIAWWDAG